MKKWYLIVFSLGQWHVFEECPTYYHCQAASNTYYQAWDRWTDRIPVVPGIEYRFLHVCRTEMTLPPDATAYPVTPLVDARDIGDGYCKHMVLVRPPGAPEEPDEFSVDIGVITHDDRTPPALPWWRRWLDWWGRAR